MFGTFKTLPLLLFSLSISACSGSGGSGSGGSNEKQPLVSGAQTGSTPYTPRSQETATVSYAPDQDAVVAVWKSRVTMFAGTAATSATLSLRLVPDGVIQTSNLTQVSPVVNFNAITSAGALQRADMKKPLKVETIVDRLINEKETVIIFIEHYGKENEARHMIAPQDLTVTINAEDESRLVTFETRDTDFAFAVAASKGGVVQPGFDQYQSLPPEPTALTFSAEDAVDEATEAKLTWTPGDGTSSGYRLAISATPITSVGCYEGTDLDAALITEFRQNFPKVFTDSYQATALTENTTVYFQLCSLNGRDPPDASNGINSSYELPRRALATLSGTPTAVTGSTSASVTVGGTSIVQYQYALRSGADAANCSGATYSAWTAVATPIAASGLTEGAKRLCVLGKKSDVNVQLVATEFAWSVDLTPPGAFTITAPAAVTNDVTPSFAWAAATSAASYQIKIATDVACATVIQNLTSTGLDTTATTLADGTYYVCVRALDAVGNGVNATNNGASFVLDALPPTFTSLALANDVADGYLNAVDHAASTDLVTLTAAGYTTATYKLVAAATACNAALTYGVLPTADSADFGADGSYKVCVKLQDAATNTTYAGSTAFVKDVSVPAFTSLARANDATDGFISAVDTTHSTALASTLVATGYTTAAYVLAPNATACDGSLTYGSIPNANSTDFGADGAYKVCVKMTDAAGNVPGYGSTTSFTLDTAGPSAFAISTPSAASTVTKNTPTVTWTDPGDASEYTVKVDDAAGCPTPAQTHANVVGLSQALTSLADGVWYVCVEASDAVGNNSTASNDGLGFTVNTGAWSAMTASGAPTARQDMTMVWDSVNAKAIVWGGFDGGYVASGAEYDPSGNSWAATDESDGDLPEVRSRHVAVWTGTQMVVWGGYNGVSAELQSGGIYSPGGGDLWTATSTVAAPVARKDHTAIWTGTSMIVFGGTDASTRLNSGGVYDPALDAWTATDELDADLPSARNGHTAVWTGTTMIVWGGNDGSPTNSGAIFDPAGPDYWLTMSTVGAPSARYGHRAAWTGSKMIVWGGFDGSGVLNDGAVYDPAMDTWTPMSTADAPVARRDFVATWDTVGSRLVVWGGFDGSSYLASGALYDPTSDAWTVPVMRTNVAATARKGAAAVWSGTQMILFGGTDGSPMGVAGSYSPP